MSLLKDKVAVVTGSTQGLGAAIASRFAGEGARVVVTGRSREKGEALAASLGNGAICHPADLSRAGDCRALIGRALQAFGGVDILVNSAAISERATLESFTPEYFDAVFHLNLRAPLLLAQAALPSLRARKGTILNIGSINAYVGGADLLVYSASKGALMTASRNMADDLKYARVRVFCLNCGWIDTEGERALWARQGRPPDFLDREGRRLPMGRLLRPEEVAEVCALLASDRAAAFSGAVIDLDQYPRGSLRLPSPDEDRRP